MGRSIGYARVSTVDQDVSLQLEALRQAGCADDQIFLDVASGTYPTRPGLEACLQASSLGTRSSCGGWIAWGARCSTW